MTSFTKFAPDEGQVGEKCDELMITNGWRVESYEQRRKSKITEGIPDRRYVHDARKARIWVELKAPGKQMTEDQYKWLLSELHAGGLAVVIDDVQTLATLVKMAGSSSSIERNLCRVRCLELVELCAKRGFRKS